MEVWRQVPWPSGAMLLKVPGSLLFVVALTPKVAMPATVITSLYSECSRVFSPDYQALPGDNLRELSSRLRVIQSQECDQLASVDGLQSRRVLVALLSSLSNAAQYAYAQGMAWGALQEYLEGEGLGNAVNLAPEITLYGYNMEDFLAFYREQRDLLIDLMLGDGEEKENGEDGKASLIAALHHFKVNEFYANLPSLQPRFLADPFSTPEENIEEFQALLRDFRYHFIMLNSNVSEQAVRVRYVGAILEALPVISEYCKHLNCQWTNFNLFASFIAQMRRHGVTDDLFLRVAKGHPKELTRLLSAEYTDEAEKAAAVADFIVSSNI